MYCSYYNHFYMICSTVAQYAVYLLRIDLINRRAGTFSHWAPAWSLSWAYPGWEICPVVGGSPKASSKLVWPTKNLRYCPYLSLGSFYVWPVNPNFDWQRLTISAEQRPVPQVWVYTGIHELQYCRANTLVLPSRQLLHKPNMNTISAERFLFLYLSRCEISWTSSILSI